MSVADMMPYLRKMLEYCIEREADEKTLLIKAGGQDYIGQHPAWDAELCDWKITHDVHVMTQMQAKRFLADVAY